jgi:hypothetical protein
MLLPLLVLLLLLACVTCWLWVSSSCSYSRTVAVLP